MVPSFADMWHQKARFFEITLVDGDEGSMIVSNEVHPTLEEVEKFSEHHITFMVSPDSSIFLLRPDVTYRALLPDAALIVASGKIWNWQSKTSKVMLAYRRIEDGKEKA
jgi:hypothetical protein